MKKLFLLLIIFVVSLLVACASDEAKELVDYQNDYIKHVNEKSNEFDLIIQRSAEESDPQAVYEMQKEKALPILNKIVEYMTSKEPQTDAVKTYHQMRLEQIKSWEEGLNIAFDASEKWAEDAISEEEMNEMIEKSTDKLKETEILGNQADEYLMELADEYGVDLKNMNEAK